MNNICPFCFTDKVLYEKCHKCGKLELFEGMTKLSIDTGRDLTLEELGTAIFKMENKNE